MTWFVNDLNNYDSTYEGDGTGRQWDADAGVLHYDPSLDIIRIYDEHTEDNVGRYTCELEL